MGMEKLDTEVRREQITEAALNLLANRGLKGVSIAAVARHVGLVPSGIYRHFKNKDEILDAVLDLMEQRMLANVQAARDEARDPLERLQALLLRHVRFIRENRAIPRLIFSEGVHEGHPERKLRVRRILRGYLTAVTDFVRQGQQEGCVQPDLDAETVGLLFFGIFVPAGIFWHLTDGEFDVTRHVQRAWLLFHKAIAAEGGPQCGSPEKSEP
jgi:AcrR family transcriptional regulator